jgi:hypothetical protein
MIVSEERWAGSEPPAATKEQMTMTYETALRIVGRIRNEEIRLPGVTYAQINAELGWVPGESREYSVTLLSGLEPVVTLYTPEQYTDYVNANYR